MISVVARVGVGGLVAGAAAGSGRVSSALVAFGLGVGAPLAVEKLAQVIPLTGHLPGKPDAQAAVAEASAQAAVAEPSAQAGIAEPSTQAAIAEPSGPAIPAEPNPPAAITDLGPVAGAAERNRPGVIAKEVGDAG